METVEELLKKCNIPKKRGGKKKQKVPFIYHVTTFWGVGVHKNLLLCLQRGGGVIKWQFCLLYYQIFGYIEGGKRWKSAYIIYEWLLRKMDEDRHTSWCDALKAGMTPLLMTKKQKSTSTDAYFQTRNIDNNLTWNKIWGCLKLCAAWKASQKD